MGRMRWESRWFVPKILGVVIALLAIVSLAILPANAAMLKKGGTMVVVLGGDVPNINPAITSDILQMLVSGQVYNTLVRLDSKGNPQPNLAKSWEITDDGKKYTFHLQKGVKWHDGKPFTSADVVHGLLQVNRKYSGHAVTLLKSVTSMEAPDPHTVIFNLKFAYPPMIRALGMHVSSTIIPKHIYEGTDPRKNPFNFKPIGTGPFKFKEYKKGSHITLVRNPDYFKKGKPVLDRIIFQIIPNKSARVLALEKGEADFIPYMAMPFSEVKRLAENPDIIVQNAERPAAGLFVGFINTRNPPFNKKEVRQAIYYGMDRDAIVKKAVFGYGKVSVGPISSLQKPFYTSAGKQYPHDPAKAKQLLDAAGYPPKAGGMRFQMRISYNKTQNALENAAQLMKAQLAKVGIDVKIEPLDGAAWRDTAFIKWNFDMTLGSFSSGPDPAIGTERLYVCRNIQRLFARNVSGYCNPKLDKIFDEASKELVHSKRQVLYSEAAKILSEDLPVLWVWDRYYPFAHKKTLIGLPADPTQFQGMEDVGFVK